MAELSIAELAALAAKTEDQNETTSGGDFTREIAPAGPTIMRFIEYIELGSHPQKPYKGKEKPDCDMVRLAFELNSPKHIREVEVEGGKKKFANVMYVTLAKKFGEKAGFKKLYNKMKYGRDGIEHMAQMLGEGFQGEVIHNTVGEGADQKTYANLSTDDGSWTLKAPVYVDPITEVTQKLPIPEPLNPLKLFLWKNPQKSGWDSLFIDGTRTVKDAKGVEREESKNWLQERIKSAKDFHGSPLETMLSGVKLPSTKEAIEEETATAAELKKDEPKNEVKDDAPFDPMAALGLS